MPNPSATATQFAQCFGSTTDTNAVEPPGAAKLATSPAIAFHLAVAVTAFKTSGLSNHISVMKRCGGAAPRRFLVEYKTVIFASAANEQAVHLTKSVEGKHLRH